MKEWNILKNFDSVFRKNLVLVKSEKEREREKVEEDSFLLHRVRGRDISFGSVSKTN